MALVYRIQYKIVENSRTYSGTRIIDTPIDEYMRIIHRDYPNATYVYLELNEEFEDPNEPDPEDTIIILPLSAMLIDPRIKE